MDARWTQMTRTLAVALALGLLLMPTAAAVPAEFMLSFNELQPGEAIVGFYAGGLGSLGTGPGPDVGVTFDSGLVANPPDAYDPDPEHPTGGNSAHLTSGPVLMNLDSEFVGWISFYYRGDGEVCTYAGPDGTGDLLACEQFPDEGAWFPAAAGGLETAFRSVEFSGFAMFDPLVLSTLEEPLLVVPEPGSFAVLALGLAAIVGRRRRK